MEKHEYDKNSYFWITILHEIVPVSRKFLLFIVFSFVLLLGKWGKTEPAFAQSFQERNFNWNYSYHDFAICFSS